MDYPRSRRSAAPTSSGLDADLAALAPVLIRRQLNRSGNILISAVEPLSDEDFYAACATGASIAWTLGHLACVLDLFATWLGAPRRRLAPEMHDVFNRLDLGDEDAAANDSPSKADSVDRALYTRARLINAFRHSQVRILELLAAFDPARWHEPAPHGAPDSLPTLGAIWESLGVHTFWHLGELSGSHPRFRGTYTLNTVLHYFYVPPQSAHGHEAEP